MEKLYAAHPQTLTILAATQYLMGAPRLPPCLFLVMRLHPIICASLHPCPRPLPPTARLVHGKEWRADGAQLKGSYDPPPDYLWYKVIPAQTWRCVKIKSLQLKFGLGAVGALLQATFALSDQCHLGRCGCALRISMKR